MISRTAVVASASGLHARPAATFANAADETGFDIALIFNGEEADAASLMDIMTLGVKHGDEVTLTCEDDAAADALDSLVALLARDLDNE